MCTTTRASTVWGLRLNRSSPTAQYGPSLTSVALSSIPRGTGLRSTLKLAALSGPSNAFEVTFEVRMKASAKWEITMRESSGGSSSHHARPHPRAPQGQRQRQCRDFLSRLPEPATEHDRSGSSSLTPVIDGGTFLIRACGFRTRSSPTPGVALSGLASRLESVVLSGLPFASSDFGDFRAHGPRMKIDDLSAPSGRFVARVSVAVTTADRRPGRRYFFPAANTAFISVFVVPSESGTGSAKAPLPRRLPPSMLLLSRALHREPIPPRSLIRPRPPLLLATRHLRLPCCLRAASPLGRVDEQLLPLAPAYSYGFEPGGPPRLSAWRAIISPRVSRPRPSLPVVTVPTLSVSLAPTVPIRPAATAPSLWALPFQDFHPLVTSCPPQRPTWMPSVLLLIYSSEIRPRAIRTLTGRGNNRSSLRATPPCGTYFLASRHPYQPTYCRVSLRTRASPCRRFRSLLAKAGYTSPTTHRPARPSIDSAPPA